MLFQKARLAVVLDLLRRKALHVNRRRSSVSLGRIVVTVRAEKSMAAIQRGDQTCIRRAGS